MTRTYPPCFNRETRTDCPKRYVGCKSDCAAWHEWLAVHAEELKLENERKRNERIAKDFLIMHGDRWRKSSQQRTDGKRRTGMN